MNSTQHRTSDLSNRQRRKHGLMALMSLALWLAGCASPEKTPPPQAATRTSSDVGKQSVVQPSSSAAEPKPATPSQTQAGENKPAANKRAEAPLPATGEEMVLFNGTSLRGWRESDFAGKGTVKIEDGKLVLGMGVMTGVTWTNDLPRMDYEVTLEAMRVDGSDFFCGLTFPVGTNPCTLIIGGWGGGLVGLSSLDNQDAANNETTQFLQFKNGEWYRVRLRVTPERIQAWINDDKVVDANIKERKVGIRWEVEPSLPFGIASWSTTGALRNIVIRRL